MTLREALPIMSASLAGLLDDGPLARPWNGRELTTDEVRGARRAAAHEMLKSGSAYFAAQAAHEWLSEHAF